MKWIKLGIYTFVLLFTWHVQAQGTRLFNMNEAVLMYNQETKQSLVPKSLSQLKWLPGGTKYSFIHQSENPTMVINNVESQRVDSVVHLSDLNSAIKLIDNKGKFSGFPAYEWIDNDNFKIKYQNKYLNYSLSSLSFRELAILPKEAEFEEYEPTSNKVAYIKDNNLYISTLEGETKITEDGGNGIVYGQAVHRNEFGINKGLFWSPKGNKLAFYRMDESMVSDYAIYDNSTLPATIKQIKYPVAGAKSHHVTVGIYDIASKTVTYMQTGEPKDKFLTNLSWSPEEDYLYIAVVNRGQNQMTLNRYMVSSGTQDIMLFEERSDKYVEPQHEMYFLPNNSKEFIWQSQRDGFNHLYLYNTEGKLIRQITKGSWEVTELKGVFSDKVIFESTKESPLERHLYSIEMTGKNLNKLTDEQGTNTSFVNAEGTYFINYLSSLTIPRKISVKNINTDESRVLLESPNPIADYKLGETKLFPIINNGTVLHCRMILPPDFDKTKKYPVIVYVYGGPHAQMVTNSWLGGSNLWMQMMAQEGYIVFTLDNRGSSHRGMAFESATFRQLGTIEIEDQIAGVNYLKKLEYVDAMRMAVHGWSFGGFMTTSLMTRTPGVFKVGVAGGPVIDWRLYEIMYTERYMDTPDENKEGYEKANLLNYVDNLDGRLLMIHGCDDDVVLWQHSLLYTKACVDKVNTNLDYFVYPGHKHNVRGKDRVHLMQKITDYINEHL